MTFAWYGHLKYKHVPLFTVILISWGIAFFEYCFQVPANRIGHGVFSAYQLKTIQEVITLVVFSVFPCSTSRRNSWNHLGLPHPDGAVFFIFKSGEPSSLRPR